MNSEVAWVSAAVMGSQHLGEDLERPAGAYECKRGQGVRTTRKLTRARALETSLPSCAFAPAGC